MPNKNAADKAIASLNGRIINGRTLKVSVAQENDQQTEIRPSKAKAVKEKPAAKPRQKRKRKRQKFRLKKKRSSNQSMNSLSNWTLQKSRKNPQNK